MDKRLDIKNLCIFYVYNLKSDSSLSKGLLDKLGKYKTMGQTMTDGAA